MKIFKLNTKIYASLVSALSLMSLTCLAVGELYCDQVAVERTEFGYSVCGVGTAPTEDDARAKSRQSADDEFEYICGGSQDCKTRVIVKKVPGRMSCVKSGALYRCTRKVDIHVGDNNSKEIASRQELSKLQEEIEKKEKENEEKRKKLELMSKKEEEDKKNKELERRIREKDFLVKTKSFKPYNSLYADFMSSEGNLRKVSIGQRNLDFLKPGLVAGGHVFEYKTRAGNINPQPVPFYSLDHRSKIIGLSPFIGVNYLYQYSKFNFTAIALAGLAYYYSSYDDPWLGDGEKKDEDGNTISLELDSGLAATYALSLDVSYPLLSENFRVYVKSSLFRLVKSFTPSRFLIGIGIEKRL